MFLAASQRSTARWAFNQNSGVLPKRRERRSAISGLTARRSRSNSFTVWRDTPRALAKLDAVNPVIWQEILAQHLARVSRTNLPLSVLRNTHLAPRISDNPSTRRHKRRLPQTESKSATDRSQRWKTVLLGPFQVYTGTSSRTDGPELSIQLRRGP